MCPSLGVVYSCYRNDAIFPSCAVPWLYVLLCLNPPSFSSSLKPGLMFLSLFVLYSLLPLRSLLEARYVFRAWEFLYAEGLSCLLLSKSPGKPKHCVNTCSSQCSTNASWLQVALPAKEPCGEKALFFGTACSVTSFSGGVSG